MAEKNRINFTKMALGALPLPPPGGREVYHDTKTPGLQVRVTSTGVKTFCVFRRVNGRQERVTLGRFPEMTPEQARKAAEKVNATIASGESPVAEKKRAKLASKTLQEVFDDYVEARKNLKALTVKDMKVALSETFPDWLDKPLTKITPLMVAERHQEFGERSEARANLGMRYLRALFNFAIAKYQDSEGEPIIAKNPVKVLSETRAWYRVDRRKTVIKPHDLKSWMAAILNLPSPDIRDYFVTVLLTGMRRSEALSLRWTEIDLKGRTLTVLDPNNHHDHTLPLSDYLADLFTRRKAVSVSEYVFADSQGQRISNFRYAQAAVEKESGVKFCPHDLRRTFATIAESLDIPAYALKRLLNHANGADVTADYIVASTERLREPTQKITNYVLKCAGLKETAEVIELKREARG
jgi:integrase